MVFWNFFLSGTSPWNEVRTLAAVWYPRGGMIRKFYKTIAIVLLLWTVADITVPGLCASERVLIPDDPLVLTSARPFASHDAPGPCFISDDDCFCCCSHIVPSPHFVLAIAPQVVPAEVRVACARPDGLPTSLYHPPRS